MYRHNPKNSTGNSGYNGTFTGRDISGKCHRRIISGTLLRLRNHR